MAFSDTLQGLGVDLGTSGALNNFTFIRDIIIFLLMCGVAAGVTYYVINKRQWNKTIVKFREDNGITRRIGVEKAKEIILPNTSVRAFYLKNSKVYLPRGSIESAENEYWYFIRNDGEWLNVGLQNINDTFTQLGLKYDHSDMRMANAALKKLVDKNYKKSNWVKEWAPYIGFGVIIIMVAIGGYLVMGESAKIVNAAGNNVEALKDITQTMNEILKSLDNIKTNSGAIRLQ